jgi:hypothetical protein
MADIYFEDSGRYQKQLNRLLGSKSFLSSKYGGFLRGFIKLYVNLYIQNVCTWYQARKHNLIPNFQLVSDLPAVSSEFFSGIPEKIRRIEKMKMYHHVDYEENADYDESVLESVFDDLVVYCTRKMSGESNSPAHALSEEVHRLYHSLPKVHYSQSISPNVEYVDKSPVKGMPYFYDITENIKGGIITRFYDASLLSQKKYRDRWNNLRRVPTSIVQGGGRPKKPKSKPKTT